MKERHFGIDSLRIVSMIMIPILHILGHGGILASAAKLTLPNIVSRALDSACFCAVNCYGLISGYVGYGKKIKYSNIIVLLLQVMTYKILLTAMFAVFLPGSVDIKGILISFLPFYSDTYWYFSAYFGMFFFIPFFNYILETLDKKRLDILLLSIFVVFSFITTLFHQDFANTKFGYSALWLAALYIIGGYLKKYDIGKNVKRYKLFLGYVLFAGISYLSRIVIEVVTKIVIKRPVGGGYLFSYVSPTILLSAVFLFLYFTRLSFNNNIAKKVVAFFTPATFGVYLIHDYPIVRQYFILHKFEFLLKYNPFFMILCVILAAICIFVVCALIDKLRILAFDLLKIKKLSEKTELFIKRKITAIYKEKGSA